jgi:hypothetical protein
MKATELKKLIKEEVRNILHEGSIASKIDAFGNKISKKLGYFGTEDFMPKSFTKYITGKDEYGNKKQKEKKPKDEKTQKVNPSLPPEDKNIPANSKDTLYNKLITQQWEKHDKKIINKLNLSSNLIGKEWKTLPKPIQIKIKTYLKQNPNEFK